MGKADLHIHTSYSPDGSATVPAVLEYVKTQTDLDVIAITDHDVIDGALEAVALAPSYGLQVIPGVEVSTADGDLLALWVTEAIPPGLRLLETVRMVERMGGLCIIPHPNLSWNWCASLDSIRQVLRHEPLREVVVGAEYFNASLPLLRSNRLCAAAGRALGLNEIGNSDAHLLSMIGCGATEFPGRSIRDLRGALLAGNTRVVTQPRQRHFIARSIWQRLLRACGYVHWSPLEPGAPVSLRRAFDDTVAA